MKQKILNAAMYAFLFAVFIWAVFPIVYVILSSFKSNTEIMAIPESILPKDFTFKNYQNAWNSEFMNIPRMLWNSIWFTGLSVISALVASAVSGYVFARGRFKLKKAVFVMFSALMFINLGGITIYPTFDVLKVFGLNKSLLGLVVMNCFGMPAVNMYLVKSFINTIPRDVDEAAIIDGCTFTGVFFRILLPLLTPVMAMIFILSFQSSWNSYIMPTLFTISNPKQQTLIVGVMMLKKSGEGAVSWDLMLAETTIAMLPMFVIYAVLNRFFTDSILAGSIKG